MAANSTPFTAKTPLDYMSEGYWQDFLAKRPVAGGIAYESQLRDCQLNESLISLQRVDTLLSQIRRDITKGLNDTGASEALDEMTILTKDRYRHLFTFLAFYAGRVLARQWASASHWYSQSELTRRYPELVLVTDDYYQEMAVIYNDLKVNKQTINSLFFALEPIGLRLFGNIDRKFISVQGTEVESGLYQAVKARLPKNTLSNGTQNQIVSSAADDSQSAVVGSEVLSTTVTKPSVVSTISIKKDTIDDNQQILTDDLSKAPTILIEDKLPEQTIDTSTQESIDLSANDLSKTASSVSKKTPPTPEIFTRLLIELDEIEVPQSAGISDYQQACKVLDQFERHIEKQAKPRAHVVFSKTHQAARHQALLLLTKSANAGHTGAMLRLAMYELLGEGLSTKNTACADNEANTQVGVNLVKQAAAAQDSRAQRLLSKLYYQGFGVTQDIATGRYWLKQAADNAHPEAIAIDNEWERAQLLITTKTQEQHSLKRYQMLIAAVAIGAVLMILLL